MRYDARKCGDGGRGGIGPAERDREFRKSSGGRSFRSLAAFALLFGVTLLGMMAGTRGAVAAPPLDPLPAPLYTFDSASPKVADGTVNPADVLRLALPDPVPFLTKAQIGLAQGDELDGLSSSHAAFDVTESFSVLFSVDRNTTGLVGPDAVAVGLRTPYNVLDQAAKGQAAGDQYMTLRLFTRGGILPPQGVAVVTDNNTLVRNNYDEGGTDLAANPETSAGDTSMDPQDNVDGTMKDPGSGVAGLPRIYFTLTSDSPSLGKLSGGVLPSGASIFLADPVMDPPAPPTFFASYAALGLQQNDDINGMIIFDDDADGSFGTGDQVVFSLAPGSPTLSAIPNASGDAAGADLFSVEFDLTTPVPVIFATASELGLGTAGDNVDALDFFLCDDALACAAASGIRLSSGIPAVTTWGLGATALLLVICGTLILRRARTSAAG